ncbi:MAG: hypothetical protein AB7S38_27085 [Vulcanimicrobiota bacterium]
MATINPNTPLNSVLPTRPAATGLPLSTSLGSGQVQFQALTTLGLGWLDFGGVTSAQHPGFNFGAPAFPAGFGTPAAIQSLVGAGTFPELDVRPFQALDAATLNLTPQLPAGVAGGVTAPKMPSLPKDFEKQLKKQMEQYDKAMKSALKGASKGDKAVLSTYEASNKLWRQLLGLPG